MDKRKLTPFSRQISRHILTIIFVFTFMVLCIGTLFLEDKWKLEHQISHDLPQTKVALDVANTRVSLLQTLQLGLSYKFAAQLNENHQHILINLSRLPNIQQKPLLALTYFSANKLTRLVDNGEKNEPIRKIAANQASIILMTLERLLNQNVTELTTSQTVHSLRYLQILIVQVSHQLDTLTLQTSLIDFELFSKNALQAFSHFNALQNQPELNELRLQMNELHRLLVDERRLLAKWRGYLRLYDQYRLVIQTSISSLASLSVENKGAANVSPKGITNQLRTMGVSVSSEQITIGLWSLVALSCFGVLAFFIRLYRVIALHQRHLQEVVIHAVSGTSAGNLTLQSKDAEYIYQQVMLVSQPEHSEEDYLQLESDLLKRIADITRLSKVADWLLIKRQLSVTSVEAIEIAIGHAGNISHIWRRNFSFSAVRQIIQCARLVQVSGQAESIDVVMKSGLPVVLNIAFSEGHWRGTIASNQAQTKLKQEISSLAIQQRKIKQSAHESLTNSYETLAQMLVQAMLQNQNMALVSGTFIQSSYRPLVRMFEWIKQQQILSQLNYSDYIRTAQDVNLVDEIHCAMFNAISEAHTQQNRLIVDCDVNLAHEARLDVQLFGCLLTGFCQLALKEQYKSQLLVAVTAIDQNVGQQIVKFSAKIMNGVSLAKLPHHIHLMSDGLLTDYHTDIEHYFLALYHILHGQSLAAELLEQGYKISFELPIATSQKPHLQSIQYTVNNKHALVLCRNKHQQNILRTYLSPTMANVIGLAEVELFAEQFDLKYLNRHKLDIVVFAEHEKEHFNNITTHIESLPKVKRPKLIVLQDCYNNSLMRNGLYSLVNAPICREELLSECERILRSEEVSNLLIHAEKLREIKYEPSQIELLLAVRTTQEHQPLWLILQWLGFKVKIVSHGKAMQKHWQTGRYLVLMNEFNHSPFIELTTGKNIARGVFSFSAQENIKLDDRQIEIAKHWHLGVVPSMDNINTIAQVLSPWLKHRTHARQKGNPPIITSKDKIQHYQAPLFDSSLINELPPVFDLNEYAVNQGSPELAAYMLEEYIVSLGDDIDLIDEAIAKQSCQSLGTTLNQLNLTANILSAKGLVQVVQQLKQANNNKAYDKMKRLLEQVKLELSSIKAYVEAI